MRAAGPLRWLGLIVLGVAVAAVLAWLAQQMLWIALNLWGAR
jgi:hypothetical protein